jgi:type I restriction enzyme S subunit
MSGSDFKGYTQRNAIDRDLDAGANLIKRSKFEAMRVFEVLPGDVLVTSRGTIGRTVLVTAKCRPGILHPCLLRVQPDQHRLIPEFLTILIQDSQLLPRQLTLLSNATAINVIYSSTLANVAVPVPSLDEQRLIIESVRNETALPKALSSKAQHEIEFIREYRTRLISDVVTGKVDVRHLAPPPGNESLKEIAKVLEPLEDVMDDVEMDDECVDNKLSTKLCRCGAYKGC